MTAIAKVKQTLATLNGAEATLRMYYVQEQNKEAKDIFSEALKEINKINIELHNRIGFMEHEEPQYKGN
ncbi:DUF1657 domain-containing protein [Clostridium sp. AL.422]|uniref:DUF1657 domain-containing protein n=1 Tax=Clostridium TaxID=1485 RepID=UPI00293DD58C|nr:MULTISPECIES: DUF1657 domain-containing protein [unclassified Clostridium]MDV4151794.1 DUF1657 domain-containing protein [Clostridium sp. AL.422]